MKDDLRTGIWRLAPWAAAGAALLALAGRFARMPWTDGHDNWLHSEYALCLWRILQVKPALASLFLDKLEVHWPPLTYFVTALLLFVRHSIWAFHLTSLLFAAVFFVFLAACLRRLTANPALQVLGMFAVLANQQWIVVFGAYDLEPALNAAIVFLLWALLARADGWSARRSAAVGLACGLALLSKLVIFAYFALPLAAVFLRDWRRTSTDRRARLALLAFFGAASAPALAWHLPRLANLAHVVAADTYALRTTAVQPWHFYLGLLLWPFGGAPLWLLAAGAARRIAWRETLRAAWLPLAAAGCALVFFSAIGAKRPWYAFGVHVLLVLFVAAALDRAAGAVRRLAAPMAVLYAALAVLLWAPGASPAYRWLSLGGDDRAARELAARDFADGYRQEEIAANAILAACRHRSAFAVACLDFQDSLRVFDVEKIAAFRRPDLAMIRGLFLSFRRELAQQPLPQLDHACLLVALEKATAQGLSWDALRIDPGPDAVRSPHALRLKLETERDAWREIARTPLAGGALAVYENPAHCVDWPEPAPPDIALIADFLLTFTNDRWMVEGAADLLFAGPPPAAPDHAELLARHLIGQSTDGSPMLHTLADRLAARLLDAGRGDDAVALVRALSSRHDFAHALDRHGDRLRREGQWARAAWVDRTRIAGGPDASGELYARLAHGYRELGRPADEADTIGAALAALPPTAPAVRTLAPRLLELERQAGSTRRLAAACAAWRDAGRGDEAPRLAFLREIARQRAAAGDGTAFLAARDDPSAASERTEALVEVAEAAERDAQWDLAVNARQALAAAQPGEPNAVGRWADALRGAGRRAEEAVALARALALTPSPAPNVAPLLGRALALAADRSVALGAADAAELLSAVAPRAERWLAETPPEDRARRAVLERLLAAYGAAGQTERALAAVQRELERQEEAPRPALLWDAADFAYAQRLAGLDDALLAQVEERTDLDASCRRLAVARRALLAARPAAPRFGMRASGVKPGATANLRAWAGVNLFDRRQPLSTRELQNATAPWSADFQTCHDAVAIARARGLAAQERRDEALAALREVCGDAEMQRLARDTATAWRAAWARGKKP